MLRPPELPHPLYANRLSEQEDRPTIPELRIERTDGPWTTGHVGKYYFSVKTTPEPTPFGLDFDEGSGRIIKLWVSRNGREVCHFERGWDKLPVSDNELDVCSAIIEYFN